MLSHMSSLHLQARRLQSLLPSNKIPLALTAWFSSPGTLRELAAEHFPGSDAVRFEVAQVAGAAAKVVVQTALVLAAVELAATVCGQAAVRVEVGVDEAERTVEVHDCSSAFALAEVCLIPQSHLHVLDTSPCLVFCLTQTL